VLTSRLAERAVTLEVCPASNVALGVAARPADVPLLTLTQAGVRVALGADDPLLFGSRLTAQYELARGVHGFDDDGVAELARMSVLGSAAPEEVKSRLLAGISEWLAGPDGDEEPGAHEEPADEEPGVTAPRRRALARSSARSRMPNAPQPRLDWPG
jgi:adenosine deaminase